MTKNFQLRCELFCHQPMPWSEQRACSSPAASQSSCEQLCFLYGLWKKGRKSKGGRAGMITVRISSPHSPEMCVVTPFMSYSRPGIPLSSAAEGFLIFFTKTIFAGGGNNQLLWGCSLLYLFANSQQQSNLSKG